MLVGGTGEPPNGREEASSPPQTPSTTAGLGSGSGNSLEAPSPPPSPSESTGSATLKRRMYYAARSASEGSSSSGHNNSLGRRKATQSGATSVSASAYASAVPAQLPRDETAPETREHARTRSRSYSPRKWADSAIDAVADPNTPAASSIVPTPSQLRAEAPLDLPNVPILRLTPPSLVRKPEGPRPEPEFISAAPPIMSTSVSTSVSMPDLAVLEPSSPVPPRAASLSHSNHGLAKPLEGVVVAVAATSSAPELANFPNHQQHPRRNSDHSDSSEQGTSPPNKNFLQNFFQSLNIQKSPPSAVASASSTAERRRSATTSSSDGEASDVAVVGINNNASEEPTQKEGHRSPWDYFRRKSLQLFGPHGTSAPAADEIKFSTVPIIMKGDYVETPPARKSSSQDREEEQKESMPPQRTTSIKHDMLDQSPPDSATSVATTPDKSMSKASTIQFPSPIPSIAPPPERGASFTASFNSLPRDNNQPSAEPLLKTTPPSPPRDPTFPELLERIDSVSLRTDKRSTAIWSEQQQQQQQQQERAPSRTHTEEEMDELSLVSSGHPGEAPVTLVWTSTVERQRIEGYPGQRNSFIGEVEWVEGPE